MKKKVVRHIKIFDKHDDKFVAVFHLNDVPLSLLRELFDQDGDDDEMVFSYVIKKEQFERLKHYISGEIDMDNCDCFLGCYEAEVEEMVY